MPFHIISAVIYFKPVFLNIQKLWHWLNTIFNSNTLITQHVQTHFSFAF